jgi:cell division protein FtsB
MKTMRVIKYLLALWSAIAVYAVVSILAGTMGFSAYNQLETEREKQQSNMETLGLINGELENSKNALLYDRDTIAVHARELGFGEQDEKFVRIVGLGSSRRQRISPGQVVGAVKPIAISDRIIRLISLCAGLVVLVGFLVSDLLTAWAEPEIADKFKDRDSLQDINGGT